MRKVEKKKKHQVTSRMRERERKKPEIEKAKKTESL